MGNHRNGYHTDYRLRKLYGITSADKAMLRKAQDDTCIICNKVFASSKDCHVDHNHETGDIRGLLCTRCNHFLVALEDKVFYENARRYLGLI